MLFDSPDSFEDWITATGFAEFGDRQGCACCSSLPALLTEITDRTHPLLEAGHWADRGRAPGPRVDGLWVNAKVFTMDDDLRVVAALAVSGGRIVAAGTREELEAQFGDDLTLIDAEGRAILPGFIEPHMHFLPIATIGRLENVGPYRFPKTEDALSHLGTLASKLEEGQWLMGRQFDPALQEGPDTLTRSMLDEVSSTHPILITTLRCTSPIATRRRLKSRASMKVPLMTRHRHMVETKKGCRTGSSRVAGRSAVWLNTMPNSEATI